MKPQAELEQALAAPLERNRVRTRTDGRGGSLAYLETHDVIRRANDVFGFGQWGHVIDELRLIAAVPVEKNSKKGVHVGYLCQIRLTVAGCQTVSGVGYGDAVEYRDSGPVTAHELAAKEAESDALKRALKNYGDQFGLALYDKDAARSTHITDSSKPAPAPSAGASKPAVQPPAAAGTGSQAAAGAQASAAPADDPVTAALHKRIIELAREFGANVVTVQKSIDDNRTKSEGYLSRHHAWCNRQIKTLEQNIAAKASPFAPPAGAMGEAA